MIAGWLAAAAAVTLAVFFAVYPLRAKTVHETVIKTKTVKSASAPTLDTALAYVDANIIRTFQPDKKTYCVATKPATKAGAHVQVVACAW